MLQEKMSIEIFQWSSDECDFSYSPHPELHQPRISPPRIARSLLIAGGFDRFEFVQFGVRTVVQYEYTPPPL